MNTGRKRRRFLRSGGALLATLALALGVGAGPASALPDSRGWELVSPVDKNGGQVDPPGAIAGGGVLQAAAAGGAVTYGSRASFAGGSGAPPASQYVSTRTSGGWATQNITVPIFSGSYDIVDQGVPYRLFSGDLARGLLLNGKRCRGEATTGCPVANPTLPGTDAPAGYQNYYLRQSAAGSFEALLGPTDVTGLDPADFAVSFAGSSPDLRAIVLSSCARLTATATDGCPTDRENLYLWSGGALRVINGAIPGAELAAQSGAVSSDGARIYWRDLNSGNLYLNQSGTNSQVDTDAGGGGTFQVASADSTVAYFTKAGDLWRYTAGDATNIATGVLGVLGASASGDRVYFQDGAGLKQWLSGSTSTVAAGATAADPSTYPPATGASRVSADGTKLLFVSEARLTGYDNTDFYTRVPDSQVFLYDATVPRLTCVSCNPKGTKPIGPSTIPGAIANGSASGSTQAYKPRVLSANGRRVFFNSADALVVGDSNAVPVTFAGINDVYQWEALSEGSCTKAAGCVEIISSGPSPDGASFVDASADGADVYFLTEASLVGSDPGSLDLYDARIGGGFPVPQPPIPCTGDACQELPPVPSDPTLTTTIPGVGNPPVTYKKYCRQGYFKRRGICVPKKKRARCRSGQVKRKGKCVTKRKSQRRSRR
jgi:hypothetical protein